MSPLKTSGSLALHSPGVGWRGYLSQSFILPDRGSLASSSQHCPSAPKECPAYLPSLMGWVRGLWEHSGGIRCVQSQEEEKGERVTNEDNTGAILTVVLDPKKEGWAFY